MIDAKQVPAISLGLVGTYIVFWGITRYNPGPGGLGLLPEIGLVGSLLLGGGVITISVRRFQNSDPRVPLAILVGFAVSSGVGISDTYFLYDQRALYLWAIPLSGVAAAVLTWYLVGKGSTTSG